MLLAQLFNAEKEFRMQKYANRYICQYSNMHKQLNISVL